MILRPQPGPQEKFLSTDADIAILGGAAGGGKSFALILDTLRFAEKDQIVRYAIFRRTTPQIKNPGSIFDEGKKIYLPLGADVNESALKFSFYKGLSVKFAHLEYDSTVYDWHGAQVECMGFDELCQFSEMQFFYMMSRIRSTTGLGGYVRGTCNPDPDSFVRKLIDWWIDDDGYAIQARSGIKRWFTRQNDQIVWHDRKINENAKSLTFIPAKLSDNKILNEKDPGYRATLESLPYVERMRLLGGNWNVRADAGMYFKREWFEIISTLPGKTQVVRYWDRASSTAEGAAYTVGTKMHMTSSGLFYVSDVRRFRGTPLEVRENIRNTAIQDGKHVIVGIEQDPGQAGVVEATDYTRLLAGFTVRLIKVSKDKVTRAGPYSSQCEARNVKLLRAQWNEDYLKELEMFPTGKFADQVDSSSGAFNLLTQGLSGNFTKEMAAKSTTQAGSLRSEQSW